MNMAEIPGLSERNSNDQEIRGGRSKEDSFHDPVDLPKKRVLTG